LRELALKERQPITGEKLAPLFPVEAVVGLFHRFEINPHFFGDLLNAFAVCAFDSGIPHTTDRLVSPDRGLASRNWFEAARGAKCFRRRRLPRFTMISRKGGKLG
jgi:hypothetical protein